MTKEEYLKELKELQNAYRKKGIQLKKSFAYSNNSVKIGDTISDQCQTIQVNKIRFTTDDKYPQCLYHGELFTKQGKPYKKRKTGQIWQCDLNREG